MKKALSVLLVLTILLSLCACGGESTTEPSGSVGTNNGEPTGMTSTTTAPTTESTTEPTTEPTEAPTKPTETETPTEVPKPTETQKPTTPPATEAPKPTETQKPDTHTHSYGEWKTVTAATCTTSGVKQRSCSCGDIQKETIPATGHKEVVDKAIAATCTKTGLTEGKHCSVCKAVLVKQETVATIAHSYKDKACIYCGKEQPVSEGLLYERNDDGVSFTVAGVGTCTDRDIVIPDTYKGYPVTAIGYNAFYKSRLTSITIPNSVTSIDTSAFMECTLLTSITIPDSVTHIGNQAFKYCTKLNEITLPTGLTTIASETFCRCDNLRSIVIPDGVDYIGWGAFVGCGLEEIIFPETLSIIGDGAFEGCDSLKSIILPSSCLIGRKAFAECDALTSVVFHEENEIKEYAFFACENLTSVTIPNGKMKIEDYILWCCYNIKDIYFGGTYAEWQEVWYGIDSRVNYTVHCTDGDYSRYE